MTPAVRKRISFLIVLVVAAATGVLAWHGVDDSVTAEDAQVIPDILAGLASAPPADGRTYQEEITFIRAVQRAVRRIAPRDEEIPWDAEREPRDLLQAGHGLCYDRSRTVEKILRYAGFRARHIALYSTQQTGSALRALLTPGTPSHAVSEVLTRNGWLVVGSNSHWLSLDADGEPVSMRRIEAAANGGVRVRWKEPIPNAIYRQPFTFVYGLYSRRGRMYPPFDFVPDVNYGELVDNVGRLLP